MTSYIKIENTDYSNELTKWWILTLFACTMELCFLYRYSFPDCFGPSGSWYGTWVGIVRHHQISSTITAELAYSTISLLLSVWFPRSYTDLHPCSPRMPTRAWWRGVPEAAIQKGQGWPESHRGPSDWSMPSRIGPMKNVWTHLLIVTMVEIL